MFYKLEPFAQRLNQSYFMIADQADKNSLQDIYGSTPLRALVGFYNSLNDRQQKNFAFVANQVLDVDTAWSVLSQIEKMIGFPVARELIDWCVANPRWEDPEMTSLLNAVLEMSKQNTEMLKNL